MRVTNAPGRPGAFAYQGMPRVILISEISIIGAVARAVGITSSRLIFADSRCVIRFRTRVVRRPIYLEKVVGVGGSGEWE